MHIQCPLGDWYSLLHLKQVRYQARRHRPLSDNIERFHPHKMPRSQAKRRSCRSKTDFHFLQKEKSESNMAGTKPVALPTSVRSEEHTSELQSQSNIVCRLLLEKKKKKQKQNVNRNIL